MKALVLLAVLSCAAPALAQLGPIEEANDDRGVIQNRKYQLGHELTLSAGVLPLDPFFKGLSAGGRYTFHINDWHAVEVSGLYSYNLDSYLTEQLLTNFGVQRVDLPGLVGLFDVSYVVKPFYGKFALANRQLLYQEVYAVLGASGSYWNDESIRVGPDFGGGIRFFLGEHVSVRADIRHAILFNTIPFIDEDFRIDNVLQLHAGLSLSFGG